MGLYNIREGSFLLDGKEFTPFQNYNWQKIISSNKGKISESDNLEEFNFIYEEILKDSSETLNFICNE